MRPGTTRPPCWSGRAACAVPSVCSTTAGATSTTVPAPTVRLVVTMSESGAKSTTVAAVRGNRHATARVVLKTPPHVPREAFRRYQEAVSEMFELIWRLLAPRPANIKGILDGKGWEPPAITP